MTFVPAAVIASILLGGVIAELVRGDSLINSISSIFFAGWIITVAAFIGGLIVEFVKDRMKGGDPKACRKLAEEIRSGALTKGYRRALSAALNTLDRYWYPSGKSDAIVKTEPERAWSFELLNFSLKAAVVYPFILVTGQWVISGDAIRLGSLEIIPANADSPRRIAAIVCLLAAYLVLLWSFRKKPSVSADGGTAHDIRNSIIKMAGGLAITGAAIAASAAQGVVLIGLAAAFAFAAMAPGAVAISAAFIVAVAPNVSLMLAALGALVAQHWIGERTKRPTLALVIYTLSLFVLLAATTRLAIDSETAQAKLLILLGFLPIWNAIFNFASIGYTRYRLRMGLKENTFWRQAFLDLVGSAVIFVIFAATVLIAYSLLKDKSGHQLFNINEIFVGLRDQPTSYIWLCLIFGATLLPVLLHCSLTIATWFFTTYPVARETLANLVLRAEAHPHLTVFIAAAFFIPGYIAAAVPLLAFKSLYTIAVVFGLDAGRILLKLLAQLVKTLGILSVAI